MEVPAWLKGGSEPSTVSETMFRADRLKTMRMRLSAAYKGINALLMKEGARDFRSGQEFGHTVFFEENVDIHHIFPPMFEDLIKEIDRMNGKSVSVPIECDENGYIDKQCPSEECEFLFKVIEEVWANIFGG